MKVADYIIQRIATAGCDTVFGVYGAANGGLIDAFHRVSEIKFVAMQSEQTAGFAAEGYSKTRKHSHPIGVAIATSGPGGQNFVTPIANCYYDSTPVLFITGQVNSRFMGDGSARQVGFQETPITAIVRPITKHAYLVKAPHEVGFVMDQALFTMHDGRPGPVLIDIPQDIQNADIDPEQLERWNGRAAATAREELLDWSSALVGAMAASQRPVLLVGGGCRGSDIQSFAKDLGVPTFPTWNALDLITSDHPCYAGRVGTYGGRGFNRAIQGADFVLSLGSRISGRIYGGAGPDSFAPGARIFAADIDPGTCALLRSTFGSRCTVLQTDAASTIRAIRREIGRVERQPDWSDWIRAAVRWKNLDPVLPRYLHQTAVHPYAALRTLGELVPHDAVVIPDCGGNLCIANHSFETQRGQSYFSSNGNSPMGFSVAAAIGAYYAAPDRPVIAIIGDGGFQINVQELQTIAHNKLPIKIVLINNGIYGITSQYQRTNFADRQIANGTLLNPGDYSTPDFRKVCDAYGIPILGEMTTERIRPLIQQFLSHDGPVVLEIECPGFDSYLPRVGGPRPIDQMELPT